MIKLPEKLKGWAAFIEGTAYAGRVAKVKLPVIERDKDEYSAGSMAGKVAIEKDLKLMTLSLDIEEPTAEAIKTLGTLRCDGIKLRLQGSFKAESDEAEHQMKIWMRGKPNKLELGDWEEDEGKPLSQEFDLTYYKVEYKGEVLVEIDVLAMKEIVGGVDRFAQRRTNLGL